MTIPHLLRLPVELHLSVIDKLELHDNHNLAFTNRYFRSIVKPPTHQDYLLAEAGSWAQHKRLLACSGCVRFRRFDEFTDGMKKTKYARGGTNAATRLCVKCGVSNGLYALGATLVIEGKARVLLRMCGTFTDPAICQATCWNCPPIFQDPPRSLTHANGVQYTRERSTIRSARMLFESMNEDELYGFHHDA